MKHKFIVFVSFILAAACLAAVCAFAADDPPSVTLDDLIYIGPEIETVNGGSSANDGEGLTVVVVSDEKETSKTFETPAVVEVVEDIKNAGGTEEYFGKEVMDKLPEKKGGEYVVEEIIELKVENYAREYGAVTVDVALPTEYKADDAPVVLVGILQADGTYSWKPVKTVVNKDGTLKVVLDGIDNGNFLLAVVK